MNKNKTESWAQKKYYYQPRPLLHLHTHGREFIKFYQKRGRIVIGMRPLFWVSKRINLSYDAFLLWFLKITQ